MGRHVSIDQLAAAVDIGPYLKAGRNSIMVRVATTLNNRLAKIDEGVNESWAGTALWARRPRRAYAVRPSHCLEERRKMSDRYSTG